MQQVLSQRPTDPSKLNPKLSPLFDDVLHKALSKSREDRFQTAREFSLALRKAIDATLGNEPPAPLRAAAFAPPDMASVLEAAQLIDVLPVSEPVADIAQPELTADRAVTVHAGIEGAQLLLVDDEERILSALRVLFRDRYQVFATTDPHEALAFMRGHPVHVIISDQRMPGMLGVDLLRQSRDISPNSVRILLTGYADLAAIVGSINEGEVYRFISKPWDNADLQALVAEAASIALGLANAERAPPELPPKVDAGVLVAGEDESIFRVVRELIATRCPVAYADDDENALAVARAQPIAVLITDVAHHVDALVAMIEALKKESPHLVTLVVTSAADANLIIELINKAQIFRFLAKPVDVGKLQAHLMDALVAYLGAKQKAEALAAPLRLEPARAPTLGRRFGEGLRALAKSLGFGRNSKG